MAQLTTTSLFSEEEERRELTTADLFGVAPSEEQFSRQHAPESVTAGVWQEPLRQVEDFYLGEAGPLKRWGERVAGQAEEQLAETPGAPGPSMAAKGGAEALRWITANVSKGDIATLGLVGLQGLLAKAGVKVATSVLSRIVAAANRAEGTAVVGSGLEDLSRGDLATAALKTGLGSLGIQAGKAPQRAAKIADVPTSPLAKGMTRLYRGIPPGGSQAVEGPYGRSFVTTEAAAREYAGEGGKILYVDVPEGAFSDASLLDDVTDDARDWAEELTRKDSTAIPSEHSPRDFGTEPSATFTKNARLIERLDETRPSTWWAVSAAERAEATRLGRKLDQLYKKHGKNADFGSAGERYDALFSKAEDAKERLQEVNDVEIMEAARTLVSGKRSAGGLQIRQSDSPEIAPFEVFAPSDVAAKAQDYRPSPPVDVGAKMPGALEEAKVATAEQAERLHLTNVEKNKRLGVARRRYTEGELDAAGYQKALNEARGLKPERPLQPSLLKHISPTDLDTAAFRISQHPDFDHFKAANAQDALTDWAHGEILQENQIKLLEQVFPGAKAAAESGEMSRAAFFKDAINAPRALMASMDISAFLRQNVVFTFSRPITSIKALGAGLKTIPSENAYKILEEGLSTHRAADLGKEVGLDITGLGTDLAKREEQFMSSLAEKFPIIGPVVRASNRFHVGFLNKVRLDVFADITDGLRKAGYDPKKNPEVFEGVARYVNVMTGRGPIEILGGKGAAPILNAVLFSPRFTAARFQMLNPVFYKRLPRGVQKQAAKDMAIAVGSVSSIVSLAALHPDVEVDTDYRSADFLKARIGDTRIDMGAGVTQYLRLYAQLSEAGIRAAKAGPGERIAEFRGTREKLTGERVKEPPGQILARFLAGKETPAARIAHRAMGGKDPMPEGVAGFSPLAIQDLVQAYKEHGLLPAAAVGALAGAGVGIQQYTAPAAPEIQERFQKGQPLLEQSREMREARELPESRTLEERSVRYLESAEHGLQREKMNAKIIELFMAGDSQAAEALARAARRKGFRPDLKALRLRAFLNRRRQ